LLLKKIKEQSVNAGFYAKLLAKLLSITLYGNLANTCGANLNQDR